VDARGPASADHDQSGRVEGLIKRSRFPHPLALLVGFILIGAAMSYVLPAGQFDRRDDPVTGRSVVVPGTYHTVERQPVNLFEAMVAIPRGLVNAGEIIFLVFLIGGAIAVFEQTGALGRGIDWLVGAFGHREMLVIPIVSLAFATGGVIENLQEEVIALAPALLILTRRLGYTPLTAVAISAGPAMVGSAFSPINPFQVGIAQKLAELPLLSGGLFRSVFLAIALTLWIATTMRHANRTRVEPEEVEGEAGDAIGWRDWIIFAIGTGSFSFLVYGLLGLGWGFNHLSGLLFNHLSGLFFLMGAAMGIVGGLGIRGTSDAFVRGFRSMAYAALLIGFARAIFVVLEDGLIVDTIVHALFMPIEGLPVALSALGMMGAQIAVHIPVPSVSGQAVLTMPVLVPLSDLLGLSRQVTVLAYQYGGGLTDLITPTNGALLAILAAAGVRYEEWFPFVAWRYLALLALGAGAIVLAVAIGLP
jgi:uncharacterized ion transporter superfamily protein YfcC